MQASALALHLSVEVSGIALTRVELKGPLYVHQLSFLNRNQDYFLFNFQLVLKILYGLSIATSQEK